jgi:hypothetical protein
MNSKLVSCLAVLLAAGLHFTPTLAQVQLKSRTVAPSAATTAAFVSALKATPGNALHGLASFSRIPSSAERMALERAGIRLLAPFSGFTYRVRVEKRLDVARLAIQNLSIDLIPLAPEDRVEPRLWREDFAKYAVSPPAAKPHNYVLNADGTLILSVSIHPGVDPAETMRVLQKHAQKFQREGDLDWVAVVPRTSLRTLAGEDIVQWIDAGPLPFLPENDVIRTVINVDPVQNFNAATGQLQGLGGNGVEIGIFDKGVDQGHGDFGTRVIRDDAGLTEYHATHIAGTIAGAGTLSNAADSWATNNNGTPFQWRGMAPRAHLIDIDQMPPFGQNGKNPDTHMDYVSNTGMDLSNHSYVFSTDGAYDQSNRARDQIIRGDATSGGNLVPPRLHVTSAGNHGEVALYGNQVGYFALTKELKNALVVGNWDTVAGRIDMTSSLGPAHDGRIKPDVVAPGRTINATPQAPKGGVRSTGFCAGGGADTSPFCLNSGSFVQRQNFYRVARGTSMAAAAATGSAALVLEQYAATYGVNLDQNPPLPSTLRAVMIHTASDRQGSVPFANADGTVQDTAGPDFVTGWGLIDAHAAVTVVASRRIREDVISATCHVRTYLVSLTAAGSARVTLGWDDVAAQEAATAATSPTLINDLDLVLVAPGGTQRYPWKLDQKIVDTAGNEIPDGQQQCNTFISVQRQFVPVGNPVYDAANPANNINDAIPPGGVPSAVHGRDHLNNVEVVDAPGASGIWIVKVIGFKVMQGPQKFSLVGGNFVPFPVHPTSLCSLYPVLCSKLAIRMNVCERFPKLCETRISFPSRERIRVQFMHNRQKLVLPIDAGCHAISCPPCAASRTCRGHELEVTNPAPPMRAEIYSSAGDLIKTIAPRAAGESAHFATRAGERYFLVLSPTARTRLETDYDIVLRLR